jgi:hypothetical protein
MVIISEEAKSGRAWEYAAWIPTTTGHLSFSNVGLGRERFFSGIFGRNSLDIDKGSSVGEETAICAFQYRPNRDIALPLRWLGTCRQILGLNVCFRLRRWLPTHTNSPFLLIASAAEAQTPYVIPASGDQDGIVKTRLDTRGAVEGRVLFVRMGVGPKQFLQDWMAMWTLTRSIRTNEFTVSDCVSLKKSIEDHFKSARNFGEVNFVLYRTGEIRFRSQGVNEINESAIRQAYYFVKDCAHVHHHHQTADDQHLPVCSVTDDDDKTWRRRVLWSLARVAGQYRREKSLVRRRQALGVLSYADSFQKTLAQIYRKAGEETFTYMPDFATYDFSHQRASIAAANEAEAWFRQGRAGMAAAIIAALFSSILLYHTSLASLVSSGSCGTAYSCQFWQFNPYVAFAGGLILAATVGISFARNYLSHNWFVQTPRAFGLAVSASLPRRLRWRRLAFI